MAASILTQTSQLLCAHGGTVQHVPTQARVRVVGAFAAVQGDTHVVAGCPLSSQSPSFCATLFWTMPSTRVRISGKPVLTQASAPLGRDAAQVPLGPASILVAQPRVSAQ